MLSIRHIRGSERSLMYQLQNPAHYHNTFLINKINVERWQSLREKWITQKPTFTCTEHAENVFGVALAEKDKE